MRQYLRQSDVCFTDLEVPIRTPRSGKPTKAGMYFHAGDPPVLDGLKDLSVNLLALCNNHSWDLGA